MTYQRWDDRNLGEKKNSQSKNVKVISADQEYIGIIKIELLKEISLIDQITFLKSFE